MDLTLIRNSKILGEVGVDEVECNSKDVILSSTFFSAFRFFQLPLLHHLVVITFVEGRRNWQEPSNNTATENILEVATEAEVVWIMFVFPRKIPNIILVNLLHKGLASQEVPQNQIGKQLAAWFEQGENGDDNW